MMIKILLLNQLMKIQSMEDGPMLFKNIKLKLISKSEMLKEIEQWTQQVKLRNRFINLLLPHLLSNNRPKPQVVLNLIKEMKREVKI